MSDSGGKKHINALDKFSRRTFVAGGTAFGALAIAGCAGEAAAPKTASSEHVYDAIVVGAGLSGLHAANLLQEQGLDVLVLEGRNRLGGRVYTLMDIPGKPEAAGELIGGNYARMLDTARRLDLELFEPEPGFIASEKLYHLKGQQFTGDEWASHALNTLKGENRELLPDRLLWELTNRDNPLTGKPLDDWIKPEYAQYDVPFSDYLRNQRGYDEQTIELMDIIIHTDNIDNTSALHELRRYAVNDFNSAMAKARPDLPAFQQVRGGNTLIIDKMAEKLNNPVLLEKSVFGFDDDGSKVEVNCHDGTTYRAKQVVCSIPYPVLNAVKFAPRLPTWMDNAIREIDYGISLQVHFLVERKFWEDDGLPASMWTDAPFERFAVLRRGEGDEVTSALAFINGDEAFKYEMMSDEAIYAHTLAELERIRPSTKGALKPIMVQSCHRDVHGAGDWVFWRPGQIQTYAGKLRDPHGNIHFAGEHTALLERGMEGAFESGERAATDLLQRV